MIVLKYDRVTWFYHDKFTIVKLTT